MGEKIKAVASLLRAGGRLLLRLAGPGALHHLLGLLLAHAALGYRLEEPGGRKSSW